MVYVLDAMDALAFRPAIKFDVVFGPLKGSDNPVVVPLVLGQEPAVYRCRHVHNVTEPVLALR